MHDYEDIVAFVHRRVEKRATVDDYAPNWSGAVIYCWDRSIYEPIFRAAASMPNDALIAQEQWLRDRVEFWVFDYPLSALSEIPSDEITDNARTLYGVLYEGAETGIFACLVYRRKADSMRIVDVPVFLPFGSDKYFIPPSLADKVSKDQHMRSAYTASYLLAAGSLFLSQKLAAAHSITLERHARKRLAKRLIQLRPLRRVVLRARDTNETGQSRSIDWAWRWTVRAHWRATLRGPRWVRSYIKGPNDKPLKPPTTIYYEVNR